MAEDACILIQVLHLHLAEVWCLDGLFNSLQDGRVIMVIGF